MSEKEKAWYEVTRSISQLDGDQLRSIADDVPGNLEDCTLLLVRVGNERSVNMCMAMAKAYARRVISPAFPSAHCQGTANPNCRKESADQLTLLCHGGPA